MSSSYTRSIKTGSRQQISALEHYKENIQTDYMQNRKTIITPSKYYGKWIAWNEDQSKVIASGDDAALVEQKAIATGKPYSLDKVPAANEFFAGSATLQ